MQIVNMGTLISTLDVGIVNVSLPIMAKQFSVSLADIQWVVTIYLLTMVILLPWMGKLSDRLERRKVYSYGFLVFGIGSLCIALSHGFAMILISRCLQGIGATMIMANSQAMVRQIFPDHERGKALGINAIFISIGTLAGPALGGLLLEIADWTWLFWINVPIAFVACCLGFKWFPTNQRNGVRTPFDYVGTALLGSGICLLMLAAESLKKEGAISTWTWSEGILGCLLLVILWIQGRRIQYGIIDRELFRHRKVWLGNTSSLIINLAQSATLIPLAFYLHNELGYSAGITGALLMIQPLVMGVIAPFAGGFRDRYGSKFPIEAGAYVCACSMLFIVFAPEINVLYMAIQLALFGIGIGLFAATNNADVMSAAPASKSSLAGSLLALVRYLGQIIGIGLATLFVGNMGMVATSVASYDFPMRILFGICCILCLAVALSERLLPKQVIQQEPQSLEL
ncbi:MFS transporter [Paenibacillus pini]|uniref:Major facilitator superfamily (MFS) profile domain-containing protein n=1 Tax=Paenibacillus pini JCM 16418 TaxID=1236976 RepID=W7Y8Y6_9BACL|nr:MFS transporter [Paenibacillus pini]GAF07425.1 hypothetical protein JCM16418_1441 [Paenibacillus pini JCM 16418]